MPSGPKKTRSVERFCSAVPAESAFRARRPTTAPADNDGSVARTNPAAPATAAAAADVPETVVTPPPVAVVTIDSPGAARNVSAPKFEEDESASD